MIEAMSDALGGVSNGVVYALLALIVVELAIVIWALVDLARIDRVVGGRKWVWAIVIIFFMNTAIGPILYFAIGRRVPPEAVEPDTPVATNGDKTARAVDALYGSQDGDASR